MVSTSVPENPKERELWRVMVLSEIKPLVVEMLNHEAEYIRLVIDLCQGNRVEAALRLGIGRTTLYRKLREPKPRNL